MQQLRDLTVLLNSLPCSCLPLFLVDPSIEHEVREWARQLPQGMDHDNLSGSALLLALLRPHLYMADPVPLRLFGYPAPVQMLDVDMNPHSGRGPDNRRTNLLEALCAFWNTMPANAAAQNALVAVQDAWHLMRLRVDVALQMHGLVRPRSAHSIVFHALQVAGNAVLR